MKFSVYSVPLWLLPSRQICHTAYSMRFSGDKWLEKRMDTAVRHFNARLETSHSKHFHQPVQAP
jgi:hypothetical protein